MNQWAVWGMTAWLVSACLVSSCRSDDDDDDDSNATACVRHEDCQDTYLCTPNGCRDFSYFPSCSNDDDCVSEDCTNKVCKDHIYPDNGRPPYGCHDDSECAYGGYCLQDCSAPPTYQEGTPCIPSCYEEG